MVFDFFCLKILFKGPLLTAKMKNKSMCVIVENILFAFAINEPLGLLEELLRSYGNCHRVSAVARGIHLFLGFLSFFSLSQSSSETPVDREIKIVAQSAFCLSAATES